MKKKHLATLVVSALALMQSYSAWSAAQQITVWEDIKKSSGIKTAIVDFQKQYQVEVNVQELPFAQQIEKLRLDGPAGIGPDVLVIPNDQLGSAVVQGLLAPLPLTAEKQAAFTSSAIAAFTLDGQLYGVPKAVESLVLIYNRDLVATPPQTLDEWYSFSRQQREQQQYGLLAKFDQLYYSWGVIGPMGGYIFNKDAQGSLNTQDVGINTPGSIEAVSYLQKFWRDGLLPTGILGDNGLNAIDSLFTEKKAAAVINGPWAFQPYQAAGINYGVAPLPTLPNGKPMSSFLGVKGYVVSTWSKDKALAQQFIEFINQPRYAKTRFQQTQEIPPIVALMNDPLIKDDEKANAVAVQSARAVPMPGVPEMQEVWGPANAALELSASGKQAPKAALDNAEKQITMQIEAMQASNQ